MREGREREREGDGEERMRRVRGREKGIRWKGMEIEMSFMFLGGEEALANGV